MPPKKKIPSKNGKRNFSREEISVLGRKRRQEDDSDASLWLEQEYRGKDDFEDDPFWDDSSSELPKEEDDELDTF